MDILPTTVSLLKTYSQISNVETKPDLDLTQHEPPRTIDDLVRQQAREGPDDVIISYPSSGIQYVDYTFQQIDIYAYRVALHLKSFIPQRLSSSENEVVVGLLGSSNFHYFITTLALTKLGCTVLFLSTRISVEAYCSLIQTTGARCLLIDDAFNKTANEVKETIVGLNVHQIAQASVYDFPIGAEVVNTRLDIGLDHAIETTKRAWIIHSSGSTGLPKPIFQTHRAALTNYSSNLNMRGFVTLPLYHAHGISSVFRAMRSRKQIYIYNAALPLTQRNLLDIMQRYDLEILYGVPYALKLLGETQEGISALAKLKVVMFGGSACPDALGRRLVDNGVNLISHYGTTETGQLMTSFREAGDKAWDYLRVPPHIQQFLTFELRSPGIYELVVLDGLPSKVASNRPDNSYATKDLFTPHPLLPNAWKYFARLDETIVLMNGEKFTPISFEQAVRENHKITESVIFGSGKDRIGMAIIPSMAASDLSADELLEAISPTLEAANKAAPGYAQLAREMIYVLPAGTEYPRTDKGTVIRAAFYRQFETQIKAVYEASEVSSGELCLSEPELCDFIRKEMNALLPPGSEKTLKDDTDFFSIGVDSLQAIQLRSTISKNIKTNGQNLAANIVFDFPTVNSLARALLCMRTGDATTVINTESLMEELISKYSTFEEHTPEQNTFEGKYILVTGATGSLGAHLVAQLVVREDVKKVYCLVRSPDTQNAHLRVIRSLRERQVYHSLSLDARKKIVALPSDFSKADLGLGNAIYAQIQSEITSLVHCAWSVNFNKGLSSFEGDCILGTHNLIALCLAAKRPQPASFNFCSSVSAVAATEGGFVPEALPKSLSYAQGMGYAQSKLVTENICMAAAERYGIKAHVLRVGQVIADTVHGIWNSNEAIPLIIQAAQTVGAVPRLDENPLWLPVDVVAASVLEISLADVDAGIMNVVNHQSFHWTRDLLSALHSAGLKFNEVDQQAWVKALRESNPDPVTNPPIMLLEFFASKYDNSRPRKSLEYATDRARALSPSLAAAPLLNQTIVDRFVAHWTATSWNPSTVTTRPAMIVLAGPCGVGKSTIATALAEKYSIPWIEGDALHTTEAVSKMGAGTPLSDEDRWVWLKAVNGAALAELDGSKARAVVVTCSALKRRYREVLRLNDPRFETIFVMLQADIEDLYERMNKREGHYMQASMLQGQVTILESPGIGELDVLPVDTTRGVEAALAEIVDAVHTTFL